MRFQKTSPYMAVVFILALLMSACQVLNMENNSASGAAQAGFSELQLGQTRFFGNVASIDADRIKVDEVVFRVDSNSHIPKNLNIGDAVAVNALLLPDQSRYAVSLISANDQADTLDKSKLAFKLYGKVDGMGGQSWVVSNEIIQTHPETVIDKGIALTSLVKVEGSLMNGELVADSIQLDSQLPGYPVGTSTPEPSGTIIPTAESTTTVELTPVVVSGNEVEFFGTLESNMGNSWMIDGKMVLIVPQTEINGNLVVGDFVKVEAWQQQDGSFIAHEIERQDQSGSNFEDHDGKISGIITEISDSSFMVAGVLVLTNSFTEINGDLQVGDYVEVEGLLQADGSILAREIDMHDESISNGSDDDSQENQDDDSYNGGDDDSSDDSHDDYDDDTDHDSGDDDQDSGDKPYDDVNSRN